LGGCEKPPIFGTFSDFSFFKRKAFFSARIVNIWNSLPNSVVDACTVNAFKARLDKFGSTNQLSLISQPT